MTRTPPHECAEVSLHAWAKINLCLAVGPPAAEPPSRRGWHPIASWMHAIDLADRIALRRRAPHDPSSFERVWADGEARHKPVDWPLENDLAWRAHRAVESHAGNALPVSVRLEKRIPVGGGLGGGSSDAAAMITGLNDLFDLGLSAAARQAIGAQLGSDIGFFLDDAGASPGNAPTLPPRPALVTGFGDRIERTERSESWIVLLLPPFGCQTPAVYQAYDRTGPKTLRENLVRAAAAARPLNPDLLFNDLDDAATAVEPRLSVLRKRASDLLGTPVHMTGSGSTLFVPTGAGSEGETRARQIADQIAWRLGVRSLAIRLV